jgi:hypothetical protein
MPALSFVTRPEVHDYHFALGVVFGILATVCILP